MGYAVHVPHYLADNRYPEAALTLLQSVSRVSGLLLPSGDLAREVEQVRAAVDRQVEGNETVGKVVRELETQYDALSGGETRGRLPVLRDSLPSGDDIAAEAERFLAGLGDHGDTERGDEPDPDDRPDNGPHGKSTP